MSHLYSFSFNLNSDWSKELAEQDEILQYMEDTVDKFRLRPHIQTSVECLGAAWNVQKEEWIVKFRDLKTGIVFNRTSTIFISAVGGISIPRDVSVAKLALKWAELIKFVRCTSKGWMTSKAKCSTPLGWRHDVSYKDKRVVRLSEPSQHL